jgi:AraC-like DNA-binding protein
MCKEWEDSFFAFLKDMGPAKEGESIERLDVNGDYCPANCLWMRKEDQSKNRRTCRFIEFNGERLIMSEWARRLNISPSALASRLRRKTLEAIVQECRG